MTVPEAIGIGLGFLAIVAPEFWPKMPRSISLILAATGLAWLAYSGILALQDFTHMKVSGWPLALIIGGLALVGAGILSHIYRSKGPDHAAAASPGLFVDCGIAMLPIKVPSDGRIFALNLVPTPIENGGQGLNEHTMPPGLDYKFTEGLRYVYRCQVTNYENTTLTAIAIDLNLIFQEAIQAGDNPNNKRSGEVTLARSWPITIGKIDPGPQTPFVFYVFNATQQFASVAFPTSAMARRIGDSASTTVPVNSSRATPIGFPPQG